MQRTHRITSSTWRHRHVAADARAHAAVVTTNAIAAIAAIPAAAAWRIAASAAAAKRCARHPGLQTT